MSAIDPNALFDNAEHFLRESLKYVDLARKANRQLKSEAAATRKENERLKKKLQAIKSENHALHIARRRLIEERNSDKEVIRKWQAQMGEPVSGSEKSTQEPVLSATIPSSPPASHDRVVPSMQFNEPMELPSQPVLPMSVGINEMSDAPQHSGPLDTEYIESQLIKDEATEANESSKKHKINSPSDRFAADEPGSEKLYNDNIHSDPAAYIDPGRDVHSQSDWLSDLLRREWHPADFKLNPQYTPNQRSRLGTERNKELRKCLHGKGCKDCSRFYEITGISGAMQAGSRHRVAMDIQPTPAGYWAMDFPGSSQYNEELGVVHRQWLDEGRDRLEEALVGGRYIFKDGDLNKKIEALRNDHTA